MAQSTEPVRVDAEREAQILNITWKDGHVSRLPYAGLRRRCPCALCNDRFGAVASRDPERELRASQVDLREVSPVGRYALSFRWRDGHATGIFTYQSLRAACECQTCVPVPAGD